MAAGRGTHRLTSWMLMLAITAAGLLAACGDDDGGGGGGGGDGLATGTRSGRVVLPDGAATPLSAVTVETALGAVTPNSDGSFSVPGFTDDPLLTVVMSPGGNALLMGFTDDQHTVIDARGTAEAFAYFAVGGFLVAEPADRQRLLDLLRDSVELNALAQTVAEAVTANPEAFGSDNAQSQAVGVAVEAAVANLLDSPATRAVLVQPSDARSGLRVNITGANSIQLVNEYRRRAHVFIERVSYVPAAGGEPVPSPEALRDFQISPVTGLKSLAGTIVDMVLGNVAYAPVSSEVIALPVSPEGARKTTYRVVTVGAGANTAGDFAGLPANQKAQAGLTAAEQLLFDMFLPLVINVLGPNHQGTQQVLERMRLGGLKGSLIQGFTQGAPDLLRKLTSGETKGALLDAYNTFITDGTLRDTVFLALIGSGLVVDTLTGDLFKDGAGKVYMAAGTALKVTKVLDAALTSFDTLTMGVQLGLSNLADVWTVDVTEPRVRLNPESAAIKPGEEAQFRATVPELTGDDSVQLVYQWSIDGTLGTLTDGVAGHLNDFESTRDSVTYTANEDAAGLEDVVVEVYQLIVGQGPAQRVLVGRETATVRVAPEGQVTLSPTTITIEDGTSTPFTATVDPLPSFGTVEYLWGSTTVAGDLVAPAGRAGFTTNQNRVTYRAKADVEGSDSITVAVTHVVGTGEQTVRTPLGQASATVMVQKDLPPQQVTGRLLWKGWVPINNGYGDQVNFLMLGVFAWKKVPGSIFYDLKLTQQAPDGSGWTFGDMLGWGPQNSAARLKYYTAAELQARYPDKPLALSDDELYWDFFWGPVTVYDNTGIDTSEYEQRMAGAMTARFEATPVR